MKPIIIQTDNPSNEGLIDVSVNVTLTAKFKVKHNPFEGFEKQITLSSNETEKDLWVKYKDHLNEYYQKYFVESTDTKPFDDIFFQHQKEVVETLIKTVEGKIDGIVNVVEDIRPSEIKLSFLDGQDDTESPSMLVVSASSMEDQRDDLIVKPTTEFYPGYAYVVQEKTGVTRVYRCICVGANELRLIDPYCPILTVPISNDWIQSKYRIVGTIKKI